MHSSALVSSSTVRCSTIISLPSPILTGVFSRVLLAVWFLLEMNLNIQAVLGRSRFHDGICSSCHSIGLAGLVMAADTVMVFDLASPSIVSWMFEIVNVDVFYVDRD